MPNTTNGKIGRGRTPSKNILNRIREKGVEVNSDIKIKKIEKKDPNITYKCTCCGKEYKTQSGHFPVSNSILYEGNNGHIQVCRTCLDKLYINLVDFYSGNEEHALEHCCRLFDWYYSPEASSMCKDTMTGYSRVSVYPSRMNIFRIKKNGTTYNDTIKDQALQKEIEDKENEEKDLVKKVLETDDAKDSVEEIPEELRNISKETINFWGGDGTYTLEEIKFLQDEFEDWTSKNECKTKPQLVLMKMLSIAQLGIRRAEKTNNIEITTKAMKAFQDLLGSANLKPTQNTGIIGETDGFGIWIKRFENEKPVPKQLMEQYEDKELEKYIETFFTGHLMKALGIKNPNELKYDEEISKYTVKPPTEDENNDYEAPVSIFDDLEKEDSSNSKEEEVSNGNSRDSG